MLSVLSESGKDLRELHRLVNIARLHEQGSYIDLFRIDDCFEELVHVEHTDDVIDTALIDRDPGIVGLSDRGYNFVPGVFDINSENIHTGSHSLRCRYIRELDSCLHELALLLVDDILIFGSFDNRLQLLDLAVGIIFNELALHRRGDQRDQSDKNEDQRFQNDHQEADNERIFLGVIICPLLRGYFGDRLTENDDCDCKYNCRDPRVSVCTGDQNDSYGTE